MAQGDWVGQPSRARDEYRRYLAGSHVVFYRETTTTLDMIRVLHQRMDVDRHVWLASKFEGAAACKHACPYPMIRLLRVSSTRASHRHGYLDHGTAGTVLAQPEILLTSK
ncbi:type II toxin-antitoxin system RelE/ParE family toxin [Burkholderia gladioli]|nr:type II toxin-antitoxin system RelE/ParE family toxin [Burkholderia gladioli]MDN7810788.1 type II toxin-antitoxin system RelE/ParE family toxin [Burkholderia gladioli]